MACLAQGHISVPQDLQSIDISISQNIHLLATSFQLQVLVLSVTIIEDNYRAVVGVENNNKIMTSDSTHSTGSSYFNVPVPTQGIKDILPLAQVEPCDTPRERIPGFGPAVSNKCQQPESAMA